jgi:hypothetical protein
VQIRVNFQIALIDCNVVGISEDTRNFLQWHTFGVWEEKPQTDTTDATSDDEGKVIFPPNVSG